MVFVRGLTSDNAVTALYNEKDSWGVVTLVDSRITGRNPGEEASGVHNQRGMYLREVAITGYPVSVHHDDKGRDKGDIVPPGRIAEDTSHADVVSPFRFEGEKTFVVGHYQTSLPCGMPQSNSPSKASGALEATKSSMRCRPRTGRESRTGVMVIRDPSGDSSTLSSAPISMPRDSTMALRMRTPWLFPRRCKVVFTHEGYTPGLYNCKRIPRPNVSV